MLNELENHLGDDLFHDLGRPTADGQYAAVSV